MYETMHVVLCVVLCGHGVYVDVCNVCMYARVYMCVCIYIYIYIYIYMSARAAPLRVEEGPRSLGSRVE